MINNILKILIVILALVIISTTSYNQGYIKGHKHGMVDGFVQGRVDIINQLPNNIADTLVQFPDEDHSEIEIDSTK